MKCPRCISHLKTETYEGVDIDRCIACHGVWLDEGELVKILETEDEQFTSALIQKTISSAFKGVPEAERKSVEPCPKCSKPMTAVNYNYGTGVVIDHCPNDHGVWLDKGEVDKLQAHSEHWRKESAKNQKEWNSLAERTRETVESENRGNAETDAKRLPRLGPLGHIAYAISRRLTESD